MSKTILITGSSSGIGKATAKHFQAEGWNVVATMRNPENETELDKLKNVLVTRLDVQEPITIEDAVQKGIDGFGMIDVLLNNAGYGAYGVLEAAPIESIRRQFDVNVIGLIQVTQAILPHFPRNKSGTVINISSIGGKMAFPLGSLYHGTKFARGRHLRGVELRVGGHWLQNENRRTRRNQNGFRRPVVRFHE